MTPLQKLPKSVGDLGKLIVATGFKVTQNPINRPIWSHCSQLTYERETTIKFCVKIQICTFIVSGSLATSWTYNFKGKTPIPRGVGQVVSVLTFYP